MYKVVTWCQILSISSLRQFRGWGSFAVSIIFWITYLKTDPSWWCNFFGRNNLFWLIFALNIAIFLIFASDSCTSVLSEERRIWPHVHICYLIWLYFLALLRTFSKRAWWFYWNFAAQFVLTMSGLKNALMKS